MDYTQIISMALNAVLSGGIIASLWTMRETKKKAAEEARQVETTNTDSILETNQKYIVEPLKKEINGLRKTVQGLTKALNRISDCPHSDSCPVRTELQKQQDNDLGA